MDESSVVAALKEESNQRKRLYLIKELRTNIRRENDRLRLTRPFDFFTLLADILLTDKWDVRLQCIQLIADITPSQCTRIDDHLEVILKPLIVNLAHNRPTVKTFAISTLQQVLKNSARIQSILDLIAKEGISSIDANLRLESTAALPVLLTNELTNYNFLGILYGLMNQLSDEHDADITTPMLGIEKIRSILNEEKFISHLKRLPENLQSKFKKVVAIYNDEESNVGNLHQDIENDSGQDSQIDSDEEDDDNDEEEDNITKYQSSVLEASKMSVKGNNDNNIQHKNMKRTQQDNEHGASQESQSDIDEEDEDQEENSSNCNSESSTLKAYALSHNDQKHDLEDDTENFCFGFIPRHIVEQLNHYEYKRRSEGIEQLQNCIIHLKDVKPTRHQLEEFSTFLVKLLNDVNFRIVLLVFDIIDIVIGNLNMSVPSALNILTQGLTSKLGTINNTVIRQRKMKAILSLMQILTPKAILDIAATSLNHNNPRRKEEILNVYIAAMVIYPRTEFELKKTAEVIIPTLTDPTRRVRQAALEAVAVLAYQFGHSRRSELMDIVRKVEKDTAMEGMSQAVTTRLNRMQLATVNDDLVHYPTASVSSAKPTDRRDSSKEADIAWILQGEGPHTYDRSPSTTSIASPDNPRVSSGRDFHSAGKSRLPWEQAEARTKNAIYKTPLRNASMDDIRYAKPLGPIQKYQQEHHDNNTVKTDNIDVLQQSTFASDKANKEKGYLEMHQMKKKIQERRKQASNGAVKAKKLFLSENEQDVDQLSPSKIRSAFFKGDEINNVDLTSVTGDSLANTWPSMRSFEKDKEVERSQSNNDQDTNKTIEESSPIPTKPTLARSASHRRKELLQQRNQDMTDNNRKSKSGELSRKEIQSHKSKRAQVNKIDSVDDRITIDSKRSQSGRSITSGIEDSGLDSVLHDGDESELQSWTRGSKSRTSRDSGELSDLGSSSLSYYADVTSNASSAGSKYINGGNSSLNKNSGNRYTRSNSPPVPALAKKLANTDPGLPNISNFVSDDENLQTYPSPSNRKLNPRRKSRLSDDNNVSSSVKDTNDDHDDLVADNENVMVVGYKMLNKSSQPSNTILSYPTNNNDNQRKSLHPVDKNMPGALPTALIGIGMRTSSLDNEIDQPGPDTTLSKATRERVKKKEQARAEKIRREQKKSDHQSRLSDSQVAGMKLDDSVVGASVQRKLFSANDPTSDSRDTTQKTSAALYSYQAKDSNTIISAEDLKPLDNSEAAIREAIKCLSSPEWESKFNGINLIRRLTKHHKGTIVGQLHGILVPVVGEVRSLRSQLARNACICLKEMFNILGKQMDQDLDLTTKILLSKASETNVFLWDDAEKGLKAMVANVTPSKSIISLINGGASHKNAVVKKATASLLESAIDKFGVGRLLGGPREIAEKVIPVVEKFTNEGSSEIRYYAKSIIYKLLPHPEFENKINKILPDSKARNMKEIAEVLKTKGLGSMPTDTPSAKQRQSRLVGNPADTFSKPDSNYTTSSGALPPSGSSSASRSKRSPNRPSRQESQLDGPNGVLDDLVSQNWRDRLNAIDKLVEQVEKCNINSFSSQIVKVFDKFAPRLCDSMSKVNLKALEALQFMIPKLQDHLSPVINSIVPALASNLASKNTSIHSTALNTLEELMTHLDNAILIPPFANASLQTSIRSKPEMIEKLSELVTSTYDRKPQLVTHYVLPVIWDLLGGSNASAGMRSAVSKLCYSTYTCMGNNLLEMAKSRSIKIYHALKDVLGLS